MAASHVWRYSERDLVLVGLSAAHAMVLLGGPPAPVVAVGLWWGANTVSHNFIHLPFFRSSQANSLYLAVSHTGARNSPKPLAHAPSCSSR